MYMDYNIGTIAKLLGVSSEALRYYEAKNVVCPRRDSESGYRYYNLWDMHMLLRAKHYKSYGYSLDEIKNLFKDDDIKDVAESLSDRESEIEKEIIYQMNLLNRIRQSQAMIRDAADSVGRFRIEKRPGIYRINTQEDYILQQSASSMKLIEEWTKYTPFIYSSAAFSKKKIDEDAPGFEFGIGINEEYASYLNIEKNDLVKYYPPCMCVHTCIPSTSDVYLTKECLKDAFEYLKRNGMQVKGDIVTQVACMTKPEDTYHNWHIVWIPV